jgi:two-component system cell cycle response regulator DivK
MDRAERIGCVSENPTSMPKSVTPQPRRRPIVLVADDDRDARAIYRMYLKAQGCGVLTARDGQVAIQKIARIRPDVIVLDLAMPRVDGWATAAQLKSERETRDIPIIALSAVQTSRDSARAAGCDAFLAKPCLPELLWCEIRLLLRRDPATSH